MPSTSARVASDPCATCQKTRFDVRTASSVSAVNAASVSPRESAATKACTTSNCAGTPSWAHALAPSTSTRTHAQRNASLFVIADSSLRHRRAACVPDLASERSMLGTVATGPVCFVRDPTEWSVREAFGLIARWLPVLRRHRG